MLLEDVYINVLYLFPTNQKINFEQLSFNQTGEISRKQCTRKFLEWCLSKLIVLENFQSGYLGKLINQSNQL